MKYLLDTNICIYYMKGLFNLNKKINRIGSIIDEFDLLIGVTAVYNNMILVTNNTRHFQRIKNNKIEDWTR